MDKTALSAIAMLFGLAAPVEAMPLGPVSTGGSNITLAVQGCGVGWHRGPYGNCRAGVPVHAHYPCWRGQYGHLHCN